VYKIHKIEFWFYDIIYLSIIDNIGGMTVKKTSVTKKRTPAKKVAARKKPAKSTMKSTPLKKKPTNTFVSANVCRSCNALPVGSVELVSLLLVLSFSLTAVLLTSVYALNVQADHIAVLQSQVR